MKREDGRRRGKRMPQRDVKNKVSQTTEQKLRVENACDAAVCPEPIIDSYISIQCPGHTEKMSQKQGRYSKRQLDFQQKQAKSSPSASLRAVSEDKGTKKKRRRNPCSPEEMEEKRKIINAKRREKKRLLGNEQKIISTGLSNEINHDKKLISGTATLIGDPHLGNFEKSVNQLQVSLPQPIIHGGQQILNPVLPLTLPFNLRNFTPPAPTEYSPILGRDFLQLPLPASLDVAASTSALTQKLDQVVQNQLPNSGALKKRLSNARFREKRRLEKENEQMLEMDTVKTGQDLLPVAQVKQRVESPRKAARREHRNARRREKTRLLREYQNDFGNASLLPAAQVKQRLYSPQEAARRERSNAQRREKRRLEKEQRMLQKDSGNTSLIPVAQVKQRLYSPQEAARRERSNAQRREKRRLEREQKSTNNASHLFPGLKIENVCNEAHKPPIDDSNSSVQRVVKMKEVNQAQDLTKSSSPVKCVAVIEMGLKRKRGRRVVPETPEEKEIKRKIRNAKQREWQQRTKERKRCLKDLGIRTDHEIKNKVKNGTAKAASHLDSQHAPELVEFSNQHQCVLPLPMMSCRKSDISFDDEMPRLPIPVNFHRSSPRTEMPVLDNYSALTTETSSLYPMTIAADTKSKSKREKRKQNQSPYSKVSIAKDMKKPLVSNAKATGIKKSKNKKGATDVLTSASTQSKNVNEINLEAKRAQYRLANNKRRDRLKLAKATLMAEAKANAAQEIKSMNGLALGDVKILPSDELLNQPLIRSIVKQCQHETVTGHGENSQTLISSSSIRNSFQFQRPQESKSSSQDVDNESSLFLLTSQTPGRRVRKPTAKFVELKRNQIKKEPREKQTVATKTKTGRRISAMTTKIPSPVVPTVPMISCKEEKIMPNVSEKTVSMPMRKKPVVFINMQPPPIVSLRCSVPGCDYTGENPYSLLVHKNLHNFMENMPPFCRQLMQSTGLLAGAMELQLANNGLNGPVNIAAHPYMTSDESNTPD